MTGDSSAEPVRRSSPYATTASILLIALAILLRLRAVGSAFLFGDETWSVRLLSRPYRELLGFFDDVGSGLALPILQKASVDLFGFSLLAMRLPSLIPGLATVVLMATTGARVVSRHAALFATALLATSTMHIFYSRFGRSYALVGLLAYLFVANLTRVLSELRPSVWRYMTIAIAGALLPWAHIVTAPFVGVTGATAVVSALVRRELRPRVLPLLAALGAGAAVALLVYLPAWAMATAQTAKFAREGVSPGGPFGTLDVLTGLAGSRVGACVLSLATVLAAMRSMSTHGLSRLPLVVAALATLPLLYVVAPYVGALPYSRYMTPALPATALLLGELMAEVVGRVFAKPDRIAPALAVLLAVGLWIVGPRRMIDDGPYSNGYLSLVPLSAFDAPFAAMPEFYRTFEAGARIIEVPSLPSRARYLYRNYYLQHRRPTLLGLLSEEAEIPLPGPYVVIDASADLGNRADYLVFHLGAANEITAYFAFARQEVAAHTPHLRGLMIAQRTWSIDYPTPSKELVATLTAKHGPPLVDDGKFLVYRLKPRGAASDR